MPKRPLRSARGTSTTLLTTKWRPAGRIPVFYRRATGRQAPDPELMQLPKGASVIQKPSSPLSSSSSDNKDVILARALRHLHVRPRALERHRAVAVVHQEELAHVLLLLAQGVAQAIPVVAD